MASVFFSYSHADEALRDQLETQLAMLKRQGFIETWHDRRIGAGEDIDRVIDEHIKQDEIILLLISADFLASDYCYDREMGHAMSRHEAGDAIVIPVILRACDWHPAPFGKLNATPSDGKPITQWPDRDQAFLEVARSIRTAVERLEGNNNVSHCEPAASDQPRLTEPSKAEKPGPRSSNLRLAKEFSEHDKDRFREETFEFIARYFENSLDELAKRNAGIEGNFRRVDGNRFTAAVYRNGDAISRCTVFVGGGFGGDAIAFAHGETDQSNTMNESLSVQADDQSMFLSSLGFSMRSDGDRDAKLSQEGAAEFYWSLFIERLQHN